MEENKALVAEVGPLQLGEVTTRTQRPRLSAVENSMETNGNNGTTATGRADEVEAEMEGQRNDIRSRIRLLFMGLMDWLPLGPRGRTSRVNEEVEMKGKDQEYGLEPNSSRENVDVEVGADLELSLNDGQSACEAESVPVDEYDSNAEPAGSGSSRIVEANSNPNSHHQNDEMEFEHEVTPNNYEPTISGIEADEVSVRANAEPSHCRVEAENEASAHKEEYSAPQNEEIEVDLELTLIENKSVDAFVAHHAFNANAEPTDSGAGTKNHGDLESNSNLNSCHQNDEMDIDRQTITGIEVDEVSVRANAESSDCRMEAENEASAHKESLPCASGSKRHSELGLRRVRRLTARVLRNPPSRSNAILKSLSVKPLKNHEYGSSMRLAVKASLLSDILAKRGKMTHLEEMEGEGHGTEPDHNSAPQNEVIEVDIEFTPRDKELTYAFNTNTETADYGEGSKNHCDLEVENEVCANDDGNPTVSGTESEHELSGNEESSASGSKSNTHSDLELQRITRMKAQVPRKPPSRSNVIPKSSKSCSVKRLKKKHECQYCKKSFAGKRDTIRHERTHTGEKPFCCPVCDRRYSRQDNLKVHLKKHPRAGPYACTSCPKSFATKASKIRHQIIHTGEKPFGCPVCDRPHSRRDGLTSHMRTHTMPYACTVCGKSYTYQLGLRKHIRKFHGATDAGSEAQNLFERKGITSKEASDLLVPSARPHDIQNEPKIYNCNYCDKTFLVRSDKVRHERIHTGEKPFRCLTCGRCFGQKSTLKTHNRLKHTKE